MGFICDVMRRMYMYIRPLQAHGNKVNVNNSPTMQLWMGYPRNPQSKPKAYGLNIIYIIIDCVVLETIKQCILGCPSGNYKKLVLCVGNRPYV